MKPRSLKKQILIGILAPLVVSLGFLLYESYKHTVHEIDEIFDAQLAQTARMIAHFTQANIDSGEQPTSTFPIAGRRHKYERQIAYQIWFNGSLALKSDSAPDTPLAHQAGFSYNQTARKHWRVFGLEPRHSPYRIYTAVSNKAEKELSLEITRGSLSFLIWVIPLLGFIVYLAVSHSCRILERISNKVRQQDTRELKPLNLQQVPREIAPLINALNEMLARLQEAMDRERQFSSHASHELRTPLSNIRLYTQLAMKAHDNASKQQALENVILATDQSTHLIEQLLLLSKLPDEGKIQNEASIDISKLARQAVEQIQPAAKNKQILIELHGLDTPLKLRSNRLLLHTMLRNLLDNAVRYAPSHSSIQLCAAPKDDQLTLSIIDQGPGIPDAKLEQVKQRFFRLAGQEINGCGLGLSIVEQAARHIGARFILHNRTDGHSGLVASIVLPFQV